MKKFIRLLLIFNLLFFLSNLGLAQENFPERKQEIQVQLDFLADSILPNLNDPVDFSLRNASIQELIRGISETHQLNVSIDPDINQVITNSFNNAQVKDVLLFLVENYKIDIQFINNILIFKSFEAPQEEFVEKSLSIIYDNIEGSITVDLKRDSLSLFAKQVSKITGKNIIIAPEIRNRIIDGYVQEVSVEKAMEKVAFMNNMKTELEGDFIVFNPAEVKESNSPQNANRINRGRRTPNQNYRGLSLEFEITEDKDTLYNLSAQNVPITDVLDRLSDISNANFALLSVPTENANLLLNKVKLDELLDVLFLSSENIYKSRENGLYLVGKIGQEGVNSTELIKVQFRSVEELDTFIPDNLKQGLQIKVFEELNGLIVSGGQAKISELKEFIKAIDEPVPNIAIEVIVTEFRKGANLNTGVKGFIGDSAVSTSGQVFPGLDVTLSSKSINDLLKNFDKTGLVNLGRVSSNFYVTLQALESNNILKLRSTPQLSTLNGHEANLTIGQSVYYLEQTQNVNPGVNPITTIGQRFNKVEANLNLTINPNVSSNDHITLTVEAEFSDFIPPEIDGAPPGNATRKFSSIIRVKNEEMIVLGGLEENSKSNSGSGVPFLSKVPILKWFFSSRSVENNKSELLVFIRPTIIW